MSTYKLSTQYPKKRAFITGAGAGLGRSFALELAKDGWTIGLCDLREERANKVAEEIVAAGGKAYPYACDVSDKHALKAVTSDFLDKVGVDLVINNAGVGDGAPFDEYSLENWDWIVGINQMGVIYSCYHFVPYLKKQASGRIINISSAASFGNAPQMTAYSATKAAVLSLSEVLHGELSPFNIKVSAAMPTFFKTTLMDQSRGPQEAKEITAMMMEQSGLGPDDVARSILKQAGQNKFGLYAPAKSKWLHRVIRWFPGLARMGRARIAANPRRIGEL